MVEGAIVNVKAEQRQKLKQQQRQQFSAIPTFVHIFLSLSLSVYLLKLYYLLVREQDADHE